MTLVGPGGMPFSNAMSGGALAHPGVVAHHGPAMPPIAPGHGQGHGHGHPNMPIPAFGVRALTAAAADAMARPFRCEHCPQSFNRRHDMRRHERIHLTIKPFPCKTCEKTFSRKDALKVCFGAHLWTDDTVELTACHTETSHGQRLREETGE